MPPFTAMLPKSVAVPGALSRISVPALLFVKPFVPASPEEIVSVLPLATSSTDSAVPFSVSVCAPVMV